VGTLVSAQVCTSGKLLATRLLASSRGDSTRERLVSGMQALVATQVCHLGERLVTSGHRALDANHLGHARNMKVISANRKQLAIFESHTSPVSCLLSLSFLELGDNVGSKAMEALRLPMESLSGMIKDSGLAPPPAAAKVCQDEQIRWHKGVSEH